eukprot:maker-scaffold116_size340332-snap-gene-0.23 protein:Tk07645 transcript:maker-scaffold116_size340332-snap-gene-0.23-mRNA-1 annotation:"f-box kelch-repeat protein skip11-like isoform x1"
MGWERELYEAVTNKNIVAVKNLLKDPKVQEAIKHKHMWKPGILQNPLHQAAYQGNIGLMKLMLEVGADIDSVLDIACQPPIRITILHAAVIRRQIEMVKFILDAGADVTLSGVYADSNPDTGDLWKLSGTPLDFARQMSNCQTCVAIFEDHYAQHDLREKVYEDKTSPKADPIVKVYEDKTLSKPNLIQAEVYEGSQAMSRSSSSSRRAYESLNVYEPKVPEAALEELYAKGISHPNPTHSSSRPQSRKNNHAPPPPSDSNPGSRKGSACSGRSSNVIYKKAPKLSCKERCQDIWETPAKRRQCTMWSAFGLIVLFTVILLLILLAKFSSGLSPSIKPQVGTTVIYPDYDTERGDDIMINRSDKIQYVKGAIQPVLKETMFLLMGGQDEEGHDSVEIFSSLGPCLLPDGYPAILPVGLKGHMVALANDQLILCGGRDIKTDIIGRNCWSYTKSNNRWTEIPGLRSPMGYGAAASLGEHVYFLGGKDTEERKSRKAQVLNSKSYIWETGPILPHPVWGHCAVSTTDGRLIVIGGWTMRVVRTGMRKTLRLQLSATDWEMMPLMKTGRATHACTATHYANGVPVVIVAGGMNYFHAAVKSVEMLILDDRDPRWVSLPDLIEPRAWYPVIGKLGNRLTIINGKGSSGWPQDSAERYEPKLKNWIRMDKQSQLRREDGRGILVPASTVFKASSKRNFNMVACSDPAKTKASFKNRVI